MNDQHYDNDFATVTEDGTVFGRQFELVPTPIDIVLRATTRMNTVSILHYSEISRKGSIVGSMDPRHLLAYLRTLFPRQSDDHFEQAAPLTQRDLLRMHHAVSKSDDIVLTVRRYCILFQIDPIKAVILADRVFLFHDIYDTEQSDKQELIDSLLSLWQSKNSHDAPVPKRSISTTALNPLSRKVNNGSNYDNSSNTEQQKSTVITASDIPAISRTASTASHQSHLSLEISTLDILLKFVLDNLTTVVHECTAEVRRIHRFMTKTFFLPVNVAEKIRRVKTQLVKQEQWIQSCHRRLQYLSEDDEEMALMCLSIHIRSNESTNSNSNNSNKQQNDAKMTTMLQNQMKALKALEIEEKEADGTHHPFTTQNSSPSPLSTVTDLRLSSSPSFTLRRSRSFSDVSTNFIATTSKSNTDESKMDAQSSTEDSPTIKTKPTSRLSVSGLFPIADDPNDNNSSSSSSSSIIESSSAKNRSFYHRDDNDLHYTTIHPPHPHLHQNHPHAQESSTISHLYGNSNVVEDLLELYIIELAALVGRVKHHVGLIVNAEETIQLRLSTIENELLLANTNFMLLLCALSFGMFITGIGGMNLDMDALANFPHGFAMTAGGSAALIVVGFVSAKWYFDKTGILPIRVTKKSYQYVTTANNSGSGGSGSSSYRAGGGQTIGQPLRRKHLSRLW